MQDTAHVDSDCDPVSGAANRNPNLKDGDILDSEQYPVVWQDGQYVGG